MNEHEYEELKVGDFVDLLCRVAAFSTEKNIVMLHVGDQLIALPGVMVRAYSARSETYEPKHRFIIGDLVRYGGYAYMVEEGDRDDGLVKLRGLKVGDGLVSPDKLALLLTRGDIEGLPEKKGGER